MTHLAYGSSVRRARSRDKRQPSTEYWMQEAEAPWEHPDPRAARTFCGETKRRRRTRALRLCGRENWSWTKWSQKRSQMGSKIQISSYVGVFRQKSVLWKSRSRSLTSNHRPKFPKWRPFQVEKSGNIFLWKALSIESIFLYNFHWNFLCND